MVGVAGGLALAGERPIVEIMFGDFIALAFDQILNFLTKSVAMYGRRVPMHVVIPLPGRWQPGIRPDAQPDPAQAPHRHPPSGAIRAIPFHDGRIVLERMLARGEPCVFFENKVLYTRRMFAGGIVDDLFSYDTVDADGDLVRVFIDSPDSVDVAIIAPGGMVDRALAAARDLYLRYELRCQIIVPARLYPFAPGPLLSTLERSSLVCVVEESVAGGTWGAEVANGIYERMWRGLRRPVLLIHSRDSVIPAARQLEDEVLVQADTIYRAIVEATGV